MKRMLFVAFTSMVLAAPASAAGPVHLQCTLTKGQAISAGTVWDLTLNESEGTIDYNMSGGTNPPVAEKRQAVFSASRVKFGSFTINRETLAFERSVDLIGEPLVSSGSCRLVKPKKNAF